MGHVGLDIGTANLVSAFMNDNEEIEYKIQRDAYIEIERNRYTDKILQESGVQYVEYNNKTFVLGTNAFELANVFNRECQRPMKDGLISHDEAESVPVIELLIHSLIGDGKEGDICCFSIPAKAIDSDKEVFYHEGLFKQLISNQGYNPITINEAFAVILSELSEDKYTGIAISFGAGLTNVSVSYMGTECVSFSVNRGGDWIDKQVSTILGIPASRVAGEKENEEIDLCRPSGQFEVALSLTYKALIDYVVNLIAERLVKSKKVPYFKEPINIICSGGTSLAKGFIELFNDKFKKEDFPIKIKEIKLAQNPLYAVAKGCLLSALSS